MATDRLVDPFRHHGVLSGDMNISKHSLEWRPLVDRSASCSFVAPAHSGDARLGRVVRSKAQRNAIGITDSTRYDDVIPRRSYDIRHQRSRRP